MSVIQVISIGYERRTVEEVIDLLRDLGAKKLVDIREVPLSRRPGFCKNKLAPKIESAGIEYQHLRFAGNPYRKESVNVFDCLGRYAVYLQEHPYIIDCVAHELSTSPVAMLCYERQHSDCHRSVLLRELQQHAYSIEIVKAVDHAHTMATQTHFDVGENAP